MRCRNLNCFASLGAAAALAFVVTAYVQTRALGQPPGDVNRETRSADSQGPETPLLHEQQVFAWHAYLKAIEGFKSGEIKDPEVVYRWSKRLMKAEQKLKMEKPAEEGHLRRMSELARIPEATTKDGSDQELKYWATQYYEHEAKEIVKAAEQAQLAKGAATPDDVVSPSPDAAVKAAETYLGAVLEGNYDEAAELAVPGSLATSRRLMDSIKGHISGKSISVLAIQNSGRRTTVLMQEAQSAENTSYSRTRTQFTVVLEPKGGRWLVTNVAVPLPSNPPSLNSPLNQSGRTPTSAAAPKETKVFSLKHAKAAELQQTLSQLLELDNADLRVAVDARTNRLLVHGTAERVEVVQALIIQLDEPGAASAPDRQPGSDIEHFKPGQPADLRP